VTLAKYSPGGISGPIGLRSTNNFRHRRADWTGRTWQ